MLVRRPAPPARPGRSLLRSAIADIERGVPGASVLRIGKGVRVWRWADVRPWLVEHGIADADELPGTLTPTLIAATNLRLGGQSSGAG